MIKMRNIFKVLLLGLFCFLITEVTIAEEHIGFNKKKSKEVKASAAGCSAASGFRFLDINNVRARINTGGDMWWDLPGGIGAQYYIPKTGSATSMFSGSLWIGGLDINNQLKLAAVRYRQVGNDYWPGPLTVDGTAAIEQETCAKYDKHFTMTRAEVDLFLEWYNSENKAEEFPGYTIPQSILDWPAHGDVALGQSYYLAPFFDADGDGNYDPNNGDYPYYDLDNELCPINYADDPNYIPARTMEEELTEYPVPLRGSILVDQVIKGDQTLWWVFNDKGNAHTETQGSPVGMEIRGQAFAFATNDVINNMTFYSYEIINRSTFELTNTFFSPWVDTDLGYAWDDYIGCDVLRGLGYCYNGVDIDGSGEPEAYGAQPPAIGVDFFQGPYIDPDGFDNPAFQGGTPEGCAALGQGPNFEVDQMAINGVNFGNGIVDDERYGMRRFVYHVNCNGSPWCDPDIAPEYYNFLRGIWQDNTRMLYGGNGHVNSGASGRECDFMFPGDSDPCNWGTDFQPPGDGYNQNGKYWTEVEAGNNPDDRRFMQSAGPFTLKPGAVNYITVGIPWARAASGGPEASVELLRIVDDKCQALFDNCFKVIDGPSAPDLVIQELDKQFIFYLTNSPLSNNYKEQYEEFDPNIIQPLPGTDERSDSVYRFEGYQIYQLRDANVTLGAAKDEFGNYDPNLVRLVAQFDVDNGVTQIVNHYFNKAIGFNVPVVEVEGGDEGISHSFVITEDAFATGDKRLVNHKQYYYTAVAYAYNEYLPYDPEDVNGKLGQKTPYLAGRKNIKVYTGIPHIPLYSERTTSSNAQYGDGVEITRLEGQGNDGVIIDLSEETIEDILSRQPAGAVVDGDTVKFGDPEYPLAYEAKYVKGKGPISIKVVDPLNLKQGKYKLMFDSLFIEKNFDVTGTEGLVAGGDTASYVSGTWKLIDMSTNEVVPGEVPIHDQNEQLFPDLGFSITMKSIYEPGPYKIGEKQDGSSFVSIYDNLAENNGLLESSLRYADSSRQWLTGVQDNEVPGSPQNWIRAGTYTGGIAGSGDWNMPSKPLDPNGAYEKIVNGTWTPYVLTAAGEQSDVGPAYSLQSKTMPMAELASVDIVMTPDRSKWTRAVVLEMSPDETLSEGGVERFKFRAGQSVDKDGNPAEIGSGPSEDPGDPNYIAETGMGWFPGYAINIETGERLNIAYGEDSYLSRQNGRDMIFNPTSQLYDPVDFNPVFGGKHYVYVMASATRDINDSVYNFPPYDAGRFIRYGYELYEIPDFLYEITWYSTAMWVGMPLPLNEELWLSNEAKIRIRLGKSYQRFYSRPLDSTAIANSENGHYPLYEFETKGFAEISQEVVAENELDLIKVVPNPYYAYAGGPGYERNTLDNRVKITNIPEQCTITIYNVSGTLVRQYKVDKGGIVNPRSATAGVETDAKTSIDWDLKNFAGVPVAGGVYIIHIKSDYGEKVVKWFGGLRPPDLNVF